MNDILISQLLPDENFGGDGPSGSRKYWFIAGCAGRTARNSTGKPTFIVAGLAQKTQVLRIPQGETPTTRIVGLKTGTNPDGSYRIKLLANNIGYLDNGRKYYTYGLRAGVSNNSPGLVADNTYSGGLSNAPTPSTGYYFVGGNEVNYAGTNSSNGTTTSSDGRFLSNDEIEQLYNIASYPSNSSRTQIEKNGNFTQSTIGSNLKITTDVNNTVEFGTHNLLEQYSTMYTNGEVYIDPWFSIQSGKIDPLLGYTGKNYEYVCSMLTKIQGQANAQQTNSGLADRYTMFVPDNYLHFTPSDFYFGTRYDNLHITSDYDKAIAYLNTGAIPDDDEYTERNPDNPNPYDGEPQPPTPPEPPEKQIENSDDSIDAGTDAEYGASTDISLPGLNWYNLHKSVLSAFINWFWNDMTDWSTVIINSITGLYGNMQNCVISIKKMHVADEFLFDDRTYNADIKLGRYTYVTNGANHSQQINSAPNKMKDVGSYTLDDTDNIYGFLDYSPYTAISIYLPYVGIVPIDTRYVRGRTITVQCAAAYETGEILYCVKCGPYKVGYYSGKASIEVPFSLESGMQMASNAVNALGNIGASVAMGGALGATNLLGQDISAPTNINSSVTSALMRYGHTKCALIIQRPQHYKLYDVAQGKTVHDYAHVNGYKYNCVRTCHLGDGYIVFDNPHIDTWDTSPTDAEVDEIYSLMKEGIVL